MAARSLWASLLLVSCLASSALAGLFGPSEQVKSDELRMPAVQAAANSYLCTSAAVADNFDDYLVGFEARSENHNAHHILLFACEQPGSDEPVWECGEMTSSSSEDASLRAPVCSSGEPSILFAWGHDAPALNLPTGVGMRVGGSTRHRYLVMQVHYAQDTPQDDHSGLLIRHTVEPQPKLAATLLLATGGVLIPSVVDQPFEVDCPVEGGDELELHPFAFRVHTHRHGTEVAGWVVSQATGDWHLVGRRDPQLPQTFVPIANQSLVIRAGDRLAARCLMTNRAQRAVEIGPTSEDEMCNFYVMYWTRGQPLREATCQSAGSPFYQWYEGAERKADSV